MPKVLAYLGPPGTFCEEAAMYWQGQWGGSLNAYASIEEVFSAVWQGEAQAGAVPIENSCEGSVNITLDLLAYEYDLQLVGEVILPVRHCLLAHPGIRLEEINRVFSHGQALAQCRKYLLNNLKGVPLVEVSSTAEGARKIKESGETWAAIATSSAASTYGLSILDKEINDQPNNETRFVLVAREMVQCRGNCRTSLLLQLRDKPGALYKILQEFASRGINLSKIESRPTRTHLGDYLFFIDIEGHPEDIMIDEALSALGKITLKLKVLGSYPIAVQQK